MIRVLMHGCNGKMGQVITGMIAEDPDCEIAAGVDLHDSGRNAYPVFSSLDDVNVEIDVIIDFCSAKAVDTLLDYCVKTKTPAVVCTTGLSEEQLEHLKAASQETAILRSANMSLGVNLLLKLLKTATETLAPAGFDVEIVEKHHNLKVDAPSGTAIAMADSVNEVLNGEYEYNFDRSQVREQRNKKEIGISAVRGGNIVGEHEVFFCGVDEVIEFKHTAYSKSLFGKGAVAAGKYLAGKPAGLYTMSDVIG